MKKLLIPLLFVLSAFLSGCGHSATSGNAKVSPETDQGARLEVTVNYQKQSGRGSNQFAIWIENAEGELVKTLFVTRFTAEGGYTYRPDCMPQWVMKATPRSLPEKKIDAYTGATPRSGEQTYVWDLTDREGEKVSPGEYTFVVEATLLGPSEAIFRGKFSVGEEEMTIQTTPEYTTNEMKNREMITSVSGKFIP